MTSERPLKVDLHTHTHFSKDSILSPKSLVAACRRSGINCVAVTDHNTIEGALRVQELADFAVIVGEEIRSADGEIIGLFLQKEVPRGLSGEETIARVKEQGGIVGVPHPTDRLRSALKRKEMMRLADQIDFIESLNARIVFPKDNSKAQRIARTLGKPVSAGSDAHSPWEIGSSYVEMPFFYGADEFLAALAISKPRGKLSSPLIHIISRYAAVRRKLGWRPA